MKQHKLSSLTMCGQFFWLFFLFFAHGNCASLDNTDHARSSGTTEDIITSQAAVAIAVTSLVVIVVMVLVLIGCADMCFKREGFQDFSNDDAFSPEIIESQPSGQFTMLPPVENTPESYSAGNVVFEPLPDIATAHQVEHKNTNKFKMRPRIDSVSTTDEYGQGDAKTLQSDPVQQKLKLQKIVSSSQLQLPRNQLHFIKELGSGWFGQALQGEGTNILPGHRKTKVVIQRLKEEADHVDQLVFLQEATPFREVNHTNVLRVLGQCTEVTPFLLVLELCPFGDVKTYLRSHKVAVESFNEKGLLLKFACDMAAGLIELHNNNFVHHDFATRNCLLGSDLTLKVGDYGLGESTYPEDYYKDSNGDSIPIRWMAPETLEVTADNKLHITRFTRESNIWSYGVALWEVLQFGQLPYSDLNNENVLRLVIREKSVKLPKPDMPISFLGRIFQLIQLCISDPDQRPSLRQVRILLLHLLASKGSSQSSLFDQKWNQLMPKKPAQVVRVGDTTPAVNAASFSARTGGVGLEADHSSQSAPAAEITDPLAHQVPTDLPIKEETTPAKPEFKKAGSPVNELDLQSELAAVSMPSPVKPIAEDENDDREVGKAIPYSGPTSPVELKPSEPLMEFVTSTPKKLGSEDKAASDGEYTASDETKEKSSEYVTALGSMGGERSSSVQNLLEEPAESTKTFASYLNTVTTSIDDDESFSSSLKSGGNFEAAMDMESVFETLPETNAEQKGNETEDTVKEQTLVNKTSETEDETVNRISSEVQELAEAISEATAESPTKTAEPADDQTKVKSQLQMNVETERQGPEGSSDKPDS